MNIQSLMKQAQNMQKQMLKEKEKIDSNIYEGHSQIVNVKLNGKREVIEVKINKTDITSDDIEMIEDMVLLSVNDALKKIDADINEKIGSQTNGLGGFL